jgi:hypothetical protein
VIEIVDARNRSRDVTCTALYLSGQLIIPPLVPAIPVVLFFELRHLKAIFIPAINDKAAPLFDGDRAEFLIEDFCLAAHHHNLGRPAIAYIDAVVAFF